MWASRTLWKDTENPCVWRISIPYRPSRSESFSRSLIRLYSAVCVLLQNYRKYTLEWYVLYIHRFVPFLKATGGEEVKLHLFLNWALDGSDWTYRPLYPGGSNCILGPKVIWTFRENEYTAYAYIYIYITYLLTPGSRVLLEKLASLQLVKKFPAFYGTRRFLTPHTSAYIYIYINVAIIYIYKQREIEYK